MFIRIYYLIIYVIEGIIFSTVTPGQFPTNWLAPVNALNNVVLPLFGLPASAIFIDIFSSSGLVSPNPCC